MRNKLIILMGISGSGKSWFANEYVKNHPGTKIVNKDSIRKELTGDISDQSMNKQVVYKAKSTLEKYLAEGDHSVIWDNTSLSMKYINEVYNKAPANYDVEIYYTERSYYPEECLATVKKDIADGLDRSNVPDHIVQNQYNKFINLMKIIDKPVIKIPKTF